MTTEKMMNLLAAELDEVPFYKVWKVWLRLPDGAIFGLPFPAVSKERANELSQIAAEIWSAEILDLTFLGFTNKSDIFYEHIKDLRPT